MGAIVSACLTGVFGAFFMNELYASTGNSKLYWYGMAVWFSALAWGAFRREEWSRR